jgi:hypothetical protein
MDPVAALLADLDREGAPRFEWVVRWSSGEGDPLRAAWAASEDAVAMLLLVVRAGRHAEAAAVVADAAAWLPRIQGLVAERARAEVARVCAAACHDLRHGHRGAVTEVVAAIRRWPVANRALRTALRRALQPPRIAEILPDRTPRPR